MTAAEPDPAERLERALGLFVACTEGGGDPALLPGAHPELRDLLEPMLAGAAGNEGAGDAAVLGDFRLVREIGRGGMGIVHEAWQRSLDRAVALKVLAPALVGSPSALARFRREAAALGRLRHPGLVEVYGFGSDGGRHWFAMELVDGEPLSAVRGRFREPAAAVALVVQVLDALQHAHAAGLVHRDVKPGNVLVRADGSAVLTDFGLALAEDLPSVTAEGGFLGTLEYASPEQVQGGAVDARTDVWSVGVLLWELLAGERPFARAGATATMQAILKGDAPPLRQRAPAVGRDLAAIVGRALQPEPERRYPSSSAFLADLRAWLAGGVVAARAPGPAERLLRWVRREPWRATAALVVVTALPLVSGSLAYLAANAPRIAAATAAEARQRREDALTTAWLAIDDEDVAPGLSALDALGAAADDLEPAIARAALLARAGRRDEARVALAPFAADPVAGRVRTMLDDREGDLRIDFAAARGGSAIDSFVLGMLAYEQVHQGRGGGELRAQAARHFGIAVAMADEPRPSFLFWWMVTAARAKDHLAFETAFRAYERHFPGSRGLVRACVLCASALPIEAGLEQLANVDVAAQPDAWFARAVLLDRAKRPDEAERAYRSGLAAEPRNAQGWLQLGILLSDQRRADEAADAFRRVLGLEPGHVDAQNRLAGLVLQKGDAAAARDLLTAACSAAPEQWRPRLNLGIALRALGDGAGALAAFAAAARLAPTQPEPLQCLAAQLRAMGRGAEALLADVRLAQVLPRDGKVWAAVAAHAAEAGQYEAARAYAAEATAVAPDEPLVWQRFAEVQLDGPGGDPKAALAAARRAESLAKEADPRVGLALARAEAATGATGDAVARLTALRDAGATPADVRRRAAAELERLGAAK